MGVSRQHRLRQGEQNSREQNRDRSSKGKLCCFPNKQMFIFAPQGERAGSGFQVDKFLLGQGACKKQDNRGEGSDCINHSFLM
ncbi:MAG: hypothetical protein Q7U64_08240 [Desulfocapsaceae bacterium]|nr:hypothetical protein [Desulfocapsaceae bacterium]